MRLPRAVYGFEGTAITGSMSITITGEQGNFPSQTGHAELDELMTLFCRYSGISIDMGNATVPDASETSLSKALLDIFWGLGSVVGKLLSLTQQYHGSAKGDEGSVQVFIHPVMNEGARRMAFADHSRDQPFRSQKRASELGIVIAGIMDGFTWGAKCGVEYMIERVSTTGNVAVPAVVSMAKALDSWIKNSR